MVDPFAKEREQIAALLQDLGDLVLTVRKLPNKVVKPELNPDDYRLVELGEQSFAYASVAEPAHYICTGCYAKGEKSVLQGEPSQYKTFPDMTKLQCPRCKFAVFMDC